MLRGGIHRVVLEPKQAGKRRGLHDDAAAARLQPRDRLPGAFDDGDQVDLDRAAPVLFRAVGEGGLAGADAGVVVEDVEAAVGLVGEVEHRVDIAGFVTST